MTRQNNRKRPGGQVCSFINVALILVEDNVPSDITIFSLGSTSYSFHGFSVHPHWLLSL